MPELTAAAIRRFEAGAARKISDSQKGLLLRKRGGTLVWTYRDQSGGGDRLVPLGAHETELDVRSARKLAADLLYDAGRGIAVDEAHVRSKRVSLGLDDPLPVPGSTRPTFGDANEDWLRHVKAERREATWKDYSKALREDLLKPLLERPVDAITRADLAEVVDAKSRAGRQRAAEKLAVILSSMWSWLGHDANVRRYGVDRTMLLRFKPIARRGRKRLKVEPTPAEVHALLHGGLDEQSETMRAAASLLLLTGQRISTVAKARREDFAVHVLPASKRRVVLWSMPAISLKSGRPHVLPLPSSMAWIWERVREGYLFSGDAGDGHLAPLSLTHLFGPRFLDLAFRPHAIRTAVTTAIRAAGHGRTAPKLILDHAEGRSGDVTLQHYDFWPEIAEKETYLAAWHAAIMAAGKET